MKRESKPPPCLAKSASQGRGTRTLIFSSDAHKPLRAIDEGAPSSSLRFLEGQGGDFDFRARVLSDSASERVGQPPWHMLREPDGIEFA